MIETVESRKLPAQSGDKEKASKAREPRKRKATKLSRGDAALSEGEKRGEKRPKHGENRAEHEERAMEIEPEEENKKSDEKDVSGETDLHDENPKTGLEKDEDNDGATPKSSLVISKNGEVLDEPLCLATGPRQRLCGLFARGTKGATLLLAPCDDVHTFAMTSDVDLAFVDAHGEVIEVRCSVRPAQRVRHPGAAAVLERRHEEAPWFSLGDRLSVGVHSVERRA